MFASLLGVLGCGTAVPTVLVDPLDHEFDVAFIVEARGGQVASISRAFGIGAQAFGQPALEVDRDSRTFVVAVTETSLAKLLPGFDAERRAAITMTAEAPPRKRDIYLDPIPIAVPESAAFFRLDDETLTAVDRTVEPALSRLTLRVPSNTNFCRERHGDLVAFGETESLFETQPNFLDGTGVSSDILAIAEVDDDHVVIMTHGLLAFVSRGGGIEPPSSAPPSPTLYVNEGLLSGTILRTIAVDQSQPARRMAVVGSNGITGGFIQVIAIESNAMRTVKTASVTLDGAPLPELYAVLIDDDDTVVAGGSGGVVVRWAPNQSRPEVVARLDDPTLPASQLQITSVHRTENPARPHLFGARGDVVFEGDAATGVFELMVVRLPVALRPGGEAVLRDVAVTPDGAAQVAVGNQSLLSIRRPPGMWEPFPFVSVPQLMPCTFGVPLDEISIRFVSTTVNDDATFLVINTCGAVVAISSEDDCIAALEIANRPIEITNGDTVIFAVRRGRSHIYVGGAVGLLLELSDPVRTPP